MERVIYYLMLLFGFLIMQRVYKWRVENGKNKSKEVGNEDKEDMNDGKVFDRDAPGRYNRLGNLSNVKNTNSNTTGSAGTTKRSY